MIHPFPPSFTCPFNYTPHPLAVIAAGHLQRYLEKTDLEHDFGLGEEISDSALGKMFGVLVVLTADQKAGYLWAYSGKLGERNDHSWFVPPVVDLLDPKGFYKTEERNISEINQRIRELETSNDFANLCSGYENEYARIEEEIHKSREQRKVAKMERDRKRKEASGIYGPDEMEELEKRLKKESMDHHFSDKRYREKMRGKLETLDDTLKKLREPVERLKGERKERSAALQEEIFDRFNFLNYRGESKNIRRIFDDFSGTIPPGGAGECAAPKLLQYAYLNRMKPLAMAEFWWGRAPRSEVRRHKYFYPACRSKCEPILGHMLKGLRVDDPPVHTDSERIGDIEIIYEDQWLIGINKPPGLLSVPGRRVSDSVQERLEKLFPGDEPLLVHRLDMSTSGVLIAAKGMDIYRLLQEQFTAREIYKEYVAICDGIIEEEKGEISLPLRVDLDNRPRQLVCHSHGKAAKTRWKVGDRKAGRSRVHFYPLTGRTHQIRVHAAHSRGLDCPIAGDDLYGIPGDRLYLHARSIRFIHPATGKQITLLSEPDF